MDRYIKLISFIFLGLLICSVADAAKYYRWVDENGNARITRTPPPKDQVVQSVEIIDTDKQTETSTPPRAKKKVVKKRSLPKKNIIPSANSALIKKVMSGGTWVLRYDRGVSRVSYKQNNKYVFRGKDAKRTYIRNGTWEIHQRKGKWYLTQKGKYTTKTKWGKTYSGQINERYILKKLTGREMVMYDAKYRNRKLSKDYMIVYRR